MPTAAAGSSGSKGVAAKAARQSVADLVPDINALDIALRGGRNNAHIARTLKIKYTLVERRRRELRGRR